LLYTQMHRAQLTMLLSVMYGWEYLVWGTVGWSRNQFPLLGEQGQQRVKGHLKPGFACLGTPFLTLSPKVQGQGNEL
jgi:hypothetical protein